MTANRVLAAQRGISEEVCKKIDQLHEDIDTYIARAIKENIPECLVEVYLKDMEFLLQELWGFPEDDRYHTYFKKYRFRKQWAGKKYRCNTTGIVLTIPNEVGEGEFFGFGQAFVDVGRLNSYSRFSNCTEISEGENE